MVLYAIVSFWFGVVVPFSWFALVCLLLVGMFLSKDLRYEARIHPRTNPARELWYTMAVILDRVLIGTVFLCDFWARNLGTLREFLVGMNDLAVEAPQSQSQTAAAPSASTSMLNRAFRLVSTATRVSSRVQGNVVREIASEMLAPNSLAQNTARPLAASIPFGLSLFGGMQRVIQDQDQRQQQPPHPSSTASPSSTDTSQARAPWELDDGDVGGDEGGDDGVETVSVVNDSPDAFLDQILESVASRSEND